MHPSAKKCWIVVVERQAEHGGQKRPKDNVGGPISSHGIEWCSSNQNPDIDDIAFSKQTLYVRLRPHCKKVGNGPPPSFHN